MNSAKVAGGAAPLPEHSNVPEPQSPVTHVNFPVESVVQNVLPHKRPDQAVGTEREVDSSGWRAKPVVASWAVPAPDKIPGHTGWLHLFTIVNVAENAPEKMTSSEELWEKDKKHKQNKS